MKFIRRKFEQNSIKHHDRTVIIGRTGTGKSVMLDKLLKNLSKTCFIILQDTKNEYQHLEEFELEHLKKRNKGLWKVTNIEYKGYTITDNLIICEFFSELLFNRNKNAKQEKRKKVPYIFVIEEMGNVTGKSGRLYDINPHFAVLLQQGRSQNVGLICTTQRPAEIHTTILSQANHIICFDVSSKHDKEALKIYLDPDSFDLLKIHEFFHINIAEGTINHSYKIYMNPHEKNYYDNIFGEP